MDNIDIIREIEETNDSSFLDEVFQALIENSYYNPSSKVIEKLSSDAYEKLIDSCNDKITLDLVFESLLEHTKFDVDRHFYDVWDAVDDDHRVRASLEILEDMPIDDIIETLANISESSPTDCLNIKDQLKEKGLIK